MRRRLHLPLAQQLVVVQLIVIAAVLLAVSAVSVEITRLGFARDEGRRVLTLAESLASNPVVRTRKPEAGGSVLPAAVTQLQTVTGIDLVMIADRSGRVVASTDTTVVGEAVAWPELVAAPQRAHSGTLTVGGTTYLMAAVPVLSSISSCEYL